MIKWNEKDYMQALADLEKELDKKPLGQKKMKVRVLIPNEEAAEKVKKEFDKIFEKQASKWTTSSKVIDEEEQFED